MGSVSVRRLRFYVAWPHRVIGGRLRNHEIVEIPFARNGVAGSHIKLRHCFGGVGEAVLSAGDAVDLRVDRVRVRAEIDLKVDAIPAAGGDGDAGCAQVVNRAGVAVAKKALTARLVIENAAVPEEDAIGKDRAVGVRQGLEVDVDANDGDLACAGHGVVKHPAALGRQKAFQACRAAGTGIQGIRVYG
jgi:hypothetical protein